MRKTSIYFRIACLFLLIAVAGGRAWARDECAPAVSSDEANRIINSYIPNGGSAEYRYTIGDSPYHATRGTGSIQIKIPGEPLLGLAEGVLTVHNAAITVVKCAKAEERGENALSYVVIEARIRDLLQPVVPPLLLQHLEPLLKGHMAVFVANLAKRNLPLSRALPRDLLEQYKITLGGISVEGATIPGGGALPGVALMMGADVSALFNKFAGPGLMSVLEGGSGNVRVQFESGSSILPGPDQPREVKFGMTVLGRFALKMQGLNNLKLQDPGFYIALKKGVPGRPPFADPTFEGAFLFQDTEVGYARIAVHPGPLFDGTIELKEFDLGVLSISSSLGQQTRLGGPTLFVDIRGGTGSVSGRIRGKPGSVFQGINVDVGGQIQPEGPGGLSSSMSLNAKSTVNFLGQAQFTLKGQTQSYLMNILGLGGEGKDVALTVDITAPSFGNLLADKAGGPIGDNALYRKAAGLLSIGSPFPTISNASATLSMSRFNLNPGGALSVSGRVFGYGFSTPGVSIYANDLPIANTIVNKLIPKVVSAAMGILNDILKDYLAAPIKWLGDQVKQLGGEAERLIGDIGGELISVGKSLNCIFSNCRGSPPPDKPSPCTPQPHSGPPFLRHGDPLVFQMNDDLYYAPGHGYGTVNIQDMPYFLVTERRNDNPKSCLSTENAILDGDYVHATVMNKQMQPIRRFKGQIFTSGHPGSENLPLFWGQQQSGSIWDARMIRFSDCGNIGDSNWSNCNPWTMNRSPNMVAFKHPAMGLTQVTQIKPPYMPKESLNIFYGQPVLIDSSRGWELAGGALTADQTGIGTLVFVPHRGARLHGEAIVAAGTVTTMRPWGIPIVPVTHNDRVAILEVDLTKYKYPSDYQALLEEYAAGRRAGRFSTGSGLSKSMAEDMTVVTLNETALSTAIYAVDSGRIWLYDHTRRDWATYGNHRNIRIYDVCTALSQYPEAFKAKGHPLRERGQTCDATPTDATITQPGGQTILPFVPPFQKGK